MAGLAAAQATNLDDQPERPSTLGGIIRNSAWLYGAEMLSRALAALLLVIVARQLGPAETGKYVFVASLAMIASTVSDFGSTQYLIRTAAQGRSTGHERAQLFWLVLGFRTLLTLCLAALLGVWAMATVDPEVRALLLFAAAALAISAPPGVVTAVLRWQERMTFEAVARVLVALLTLVVGGALILAGYGVVSLGVAGLVAGLVAIVYYGVVPRRFVRVPRPTRFGLVDLPAVAVGAWPYFSTSILVVVYSRLDAVLLQQLLGPKAVGEYGVVVRVMELLFVIPGVLGTALFPAIAKNLVGRPAVVMRYGLRAMIILTLISVPIAVTGTVLGPGLFPVLFGQGFAASGGAFQILVWTIVPVFASIVTSSIIAAGRRPIVNTYLAVGMVLISAVGNVLLIPRYGISGAAAVRLVTELSGLISGALYIAVAMGPNRGER